MDFELRIVWKLWKVENVIRCGPFVEGASAVRARPARSFCTATEGSVALPTTCFVEESDGYTQSYGANKVGSGAFLPGPKRSTFR